MRDIIGHEAGADSAGIEQLELRQKILEQEAELRNAPFISVRREIRQRVFKLQQQLDWLERIYGRKG